MTEATVHCSFKNAARLQLRLTGAGVAAVARRITGRSCFRNVPRLGGIKLLCRCLSEFWHHLVLEARPTAMDSTQKAPQLSLFVQRLQQKARGELTIIFKFLLRIILIRS